MKLKGHLQRMITMGVLLIGVVNLSGCLATNKVLDLRKERETRKKEAINFWSLAAVRSAHVMPGGEVFACVEFRDSPAAEPQAFTIRPSQASQVGKTYSDFMPADYRRVENQHQAEAQPELISYLYPLIDAEKGCDKPTGNSSLPVSGLKIETIQIPREDQSQLPEILLSSASGPADEGRIIEVSFVSKEPSTKAEPELKKRPLPGPSDAKDILLVFLPAAGRGEQVRAIGIAGAFEPGSEWVNPYTLLVAPAVAADVILDTAIVILGVSASAGWACGR